MSFSATLKYLRSESDLTQKELAEKTGLSLPSIISYENGLRTPNSKAMAKLEAFFHVSADYLLGNVDLRERDKQLLDIFEKLKNAEAYKRFNEDYHFFTFENQAHAIEAINTFYTHLLNMVSISEHGQKKIYPNFSIDLDSALLLLTKLNDIGRSEFISRGYELAELSKYTNLYIKLNDKNKMNPALAKKQKKRKIDIPVYDQPASAGIGNYLNDDELFELLTFDEDEIPPNAKFGIRISGDSMEPKIKDGDIVWVEPKLQVDNGDIGIFTIDRDAYCKKLEVDHSKRRVSFVSLNPKYKPIIINEFNDSVDIRTIGKVLL